MKKWMMTLGLISMIGLSVNAQQRRGGEKPSPEERAKKSTERMAEHLELSEAQKTQILDLNLEFAKAQEDQMEERREQGEARKEAMQAQEEKIKAILTPEQAEKWEVAKKERNRGRRGDRDRGREGQRRGPSGGNR